MLKNFTGKKIKNKNTKPFFDGLNHFANLVSHSLVFIKENETPKGTGLLVNHNFLMSTMWVIEDYLIKNLTVVSHISFDNEVRKIVQCTDKRSIGLARVSTSTPKTCYPQISKIKFGFNHGSQPKNCNKILNLKCLKKWKFFFSLY